MMATKDEGTMPLSDYAHHNEEARLMWWLEEGRFEGTENPDDFDEMMDNWIEPEPDEEQEEVGVEDNYPHREFDEPDEPHEPEYFDERGYEGY